VASGARAQDATPEEVPGGDESDDRIVVTVRGHAETVASDVVLEYIIRGEAEDAAGAQKAYEKRIRKVMKGMNDVTPITSLVTVEVTPDRHVQANGVVFKLNAQNGRGSQTEVGTTFSGRLFVAINGLARVPVDIGRLRLAQVMTQLSDCELTGAEDEVDIMYARMSVDRDELKKRSEADAMAKARKRAEALARMTQRKLGKVSTVREVSAVLNDEQQLWTSTYFNFVFPGSTSGWNAKTQVACDTEIVVTFELEDWNR
jgi:uncharacterized protein YggE